MSNPFAALKSEDTSIKQEKDSLGGGFIWESGAYPVTIVMAYAGKAASGANSMNFEFKGEDGRIYKDVEWVTSGTAKGGLPYYEKDGVKSYLPGYNIANAIALLAAQKELSELTFEEKLVKIYNKDAGGDVPTKVDVAVELLGKQVIVGLLKRTENKSVKDGAGNYQMTDEPREVNLVDKVFHAETKKTIAEYRAKAEEASFYQPWVDKNTGVTQDRMKKGAGVVAGVPAGTGGATGGGKPASSLFD